MGEGRKEGASARAACILGLATVWPSLHNQILYPLTLTFNKDGAPPALYFYLIYAVLAIATCVVLIALHERRCPLFESQWAVFGIGALGVLGLAMLSVCGFGTLLSTVLVGVAAGLCAVSVPVMFVFWSARIIRQDTRAVVDVLVSYLVACILVVLRLALGIHTAAFSTVMGTASCALVLVAGPRGMHPRTEGMAGLKPLPNQILVPGFVVLVMLEAGITYINPPTAAFGYPSQFRIAAYGMAALATVVLLAVYHVGRETPYRASLAAFAILATAAITSMLVTGLVRPMREELGNYLLIGSSTLLEMYLWLVVLDVAKVKRLSIVLPATLYLALCVFVPNLLEALSLNLGLFADPQDAILLAVFVTFAVAIAALLNVLFATILLHPHASKRTDTAPSESTDQDAPGARARSSAPESALPAAQDPLEEAFAKVQSEFGLSERQMDVVRLAYRNRTARRIGEELYISEGTVKTHLKTIYKRLDIHSKQDLIDLVDARL